MASNPASPRSGEALCVRIEDLEGLQERFVECYDASNALLMLAELHEIPANVLVPSFDIASKIVDSAFMLLPSMLRLLAEGIESRTRRNLAELQALQDPKWNPQPGKRGEA